jgi:hypothetical protein
MLISPKNSAASDTTRCVTDAPGRRMNSPRRRDEMGASGEEDCPRAGRERLSALFQDGRR